MEQHQRFIIKVRKTKGCWYWLGGKSSAGYGQFYFHYDGKRGGRAHRYSYQYYHKEKIPDGLTIDHKCNNTSCVNPKHLRIMSLKDNLLRGNGWGAKNARKTKCSNGHRFTPENTYYAPNVNQRACIKCMRERIRKIRRKRKITKIENQHE